MRRLVSITSLVLVVLPASSPATPLAELVQEAVAARKLRDSDLKGTGGPRTPFREVCPAGGLLIGLEVAVGGPPPAERVIAVRPIYRVGTATRTGAAAGQFLADNVTRTRRLVARAGYAVGGLEVAGDQRLDGLSVRFFRLTDSALDPADAYDSEWVGSTMTGPREFLDGQGQPVVGLFGRLEGESVLGLGLTFADIPRPEPTAAAAPQTVVARSLPEPAAEPPSSSGWGLLPVLVFVGVSVALAGVGFVAVRRRPGGVQQLPRLKVIEEPPHPVVIPDRPMHEIVQMETDCFRN